MINKLLALLVLFSSCSLAMAQSAYQDVREGNNFFKSNKFQEAETKYREGVRKDGELIESAYNLGNTLYRQGKFEDASRYFMQAANKTEDKELKSKAFHNLGNSLIKSEKLEEGIKAYKNALINNPKDEESRYNLAYAQQQLQQQQQQEQEQDENKEDKKDEQEEKEDQENKDQENQEEKEEEKEQEQENKEEQEPKEEEQKQQPEPKEDQVSRADAERILEALNNKEKELQEKLKKQKVKEVNIDIEKDW